MKKTILIAFLLTIALAACDKKDETTATPAVETPAVEAPAIETPAVETPAIEAPAIGAQTK